MPAPSPTPRTIPDCTVNARTVTGKSYFRADILNSHNGSNGDLIAAAQMWSEGASTKEIADALFLHESDVWNALDAIKAVKVEEAA